MIKLKFPQELTNDQNFTQLIKQHLFSHFFSFSENVRSLNNDSLHTFLPQHENQIVIFLKQTLSQQQFENTKILINQLLQGSIVYEKSLVLPYENNLNWNKEVIMMKPNSSDMENNFQLKLKPNSSVKIEVIDKNGQKSYQICNIKSEGVVQVLNNTFSLIRQFAEDCFQKALQKKLPLIFTSKNTILKQYDGQQKQIFEELYQSKYIEQFKKHNIYYEHRLIDDMVAYVIKSGGGFIWACKSYDAEIESKIIEFGYGQQDQCLQYISSNGNHQTLVISSSKNKSQFLQILSSFIEHLLKIQNCLKSKKILKEMQKVTNNLLREKSEHYMKNFNEEEFLFEIRNQVQKNLIGFKLQLNLKYYLRFYNQQVILTLYQNDEG